MQEQTHEPDRRVQRTHDAILRAFVQLVFERRYEAIRIADLTAAANVGRATFYEHFRSKDDVLLTAMDPILLPLANAASGRGAKPHLRMMLSHVWEKRSIGRILLLSVTGVRLQRRLAAMIQARVDGEKAGQDLASIQAAAAAAAQMAMLRSWISGEASCPADTLADQLINCSRLVLRTPPVG